MALKTTLEQLEEVQAAISEVMTSQELNSGQGRGVVRARLDLLEAREEKLQARYNREQSNASYAGPAVAHGTPSRDY